jgi:excisionase family DNA binding protein
MVPRRLEDKKMDLITVGEAGKILNLSADSVRRLDREGVLRAAIRVGGQRLFSQAEVERLRVQRQKDLTSQDR